MKLPAAIVLFVTLVPLSSSTLAETRWVNLGEDLETAETSSNAGSFFPAYFTFIRTSLHRFRLSAVRAEEYGKKRATVETLCSLARGSVCINASFFDENGDPLGLVVSRGITSRKVHKGGKTLNGVFMLSRSGPSIHNRFDPILTSAVEAVQSGPVLIKEGKVVEGIRESFPASRRSGVCVDGAGRLVFFIASANFSAISIETLQNVLSNPDIGCRDALNLDGGGSSQLYVDPDAGRDSPGYQVLYIAGSDEVPVALSLIVRQ